MFMLDGYVLSHEGKVRENNEDNFILFGRNKKDINENRVSLSKNAIAGKKLAGVFDGMGGEASGEIASIIASECFSACGLENAGASIRTQFFEANRKICSLMAERGCNMGTTAALMYFDGNAGICANIGDSRAYLYRHGALTQLSVDHSEGQMLIDSGMATVDEVKKSTSWHRLVRFLGIPENEYVAEPFIGAPIDVQENDLFILCTDGLTDMISDNELTDLLSMYASDNELSDLAGRLLGRAVENGGEDNITIMLIQVGLKLPV